MHHHLLPTMQDESSRGLIPLSMRHHLLSFVLRHGAEEVC